LAGHRWIRLGVDVACLEVGRHLEWVCSGKVSAGKGRSSFDGVIASS
jgi:hypothetical protein